MASAAGTLLLEAALGYPTWIQRRIGHPVDWIAGLITGLEKRLNRTTAEPWRGRTLGVITAAAVITCGASFGEALRRLAGRFGAPGVWRLLLATPGLAQRSLYAHVDAVRRPLERGDLESARRAVGRIVGRDTERLSEGGVAAAALESLAESFCDGVVAPALWLSFAGLPGLYAYKAANTADSLIGHLEPRWRAFGWAAARADDLANLAPARLAGALIALVGGGGWRAMLRDASKHASPNAGWPEAAMAGALRVRLGGAAVYDGLLVERPTFEAEAPAPTAEALSRGLAVYRRACVLLIVGLGALEIVRRRR